MAYSEKDLFLVLTVLCLLVVIYLIVSVWRSAGKKAPQSGAPQPKRIERIRRVEAPAAAPVLPKVPKPEPVKEAPRLPHAALLKNEAGKAIATVRATDVSFLIPVDRRIQTVSEASLQLLLQYFKLEGEAGVIVQRTNDSTDLVARTMTVFDQKGEMLIQTVPLELDVRSWPLAHSIDLQEVLLKEVAGLYRREFLERLTWQKQVFLLRLEQCSFEELLQVPLHESICRPLTLLLAQRLIECKDHWMRCALFDRLEGGLEGFSFEIPNDGANLNQRIKLHLFALSQKKPVFHFVRANEQLNVLSL